MDLFLFIIVACDFEDFSREKLESPSPLSLQTKNLKSCLVLFVAPALRKIGLGWVLERDLKLSRLNNPLC